jgi:hypothetical protein
MVPEQHPVELDESHAPPNAAPSHPDSIESSEQEGWDFVHFLGSHVESMETRAAIIVPAQLAGAIALWTQLYTFEETIPRTLAWISWAALIVGLIVAAWITTPGSSRHECGSTRGRDLRDPPRASARPQRRHAGFHRHLTARARPCRSRVRPRQGLLLGIGVEPGYTVRWPRAPTSVRGRGVRGGTWTDPRRAGSIPACAPVAPARSRPRQKAPAMPAYQRTRSLEAPTRLRCARGAPRLRQSWPAAALGSPL